MGSGGNEEQADPNEIVVDVFGIVHIYNPVNQKQLNTNLREDGQSPVPPAAPTAAATTPEVTPVSAPAKSG